MKCIDVSSHNGVISWCNVKSSVDYAIIRLGYGQGNQDNRAIKNVINAKSNDIKIGGYWFSYAYTVEMAKKEAEFVIMMLDNFKKNNILFDLPIFFDFEYDSSNYAKKQGVIITKKLLQDMTTAFCETLIEHNVQPGVYFNIDYYNKYYYDYFNIHNYNYYKWVAKWSKTEPNIPYDIWQSTSVGKVKGINTNVDLNEIKTNFINETNDIINPKKLTIDFIRW